VRARHHGLVRRRGESGQCVAAIIGAGIIPAGLEMMIAGDARRGAVRGRGYDLEAAAILLCESDAPKPRSSTRSSTWRGAATSRRRALRRLEERGRAASLCRGARPPSRRRAHLADYYCMDGTIRAAPGRGAQLHRRDEKKYRCAARSVSRGRRQPASADLFDANNAGELHRTEQFAAEVLEKCVAVGGTITGEHGVGVEKINQMCTQSAPRSWNCSRVKRPSIRTRCSTRVRPSNPRALRRIRRMRVVARPAASRAAALEPRRIEPRSVDARSGTACVRAAAARISTATRRAANCSTRARMPAS